MAEAISRIPEERLKRFVKHVSIASKKAEKREKARRELERKVERLKSLVSKKGVKKEAVAAALEDFDDKLNKILKRESRILLRQEKEGMSADKLHEEISTIRDSLSAVGKYDVETIEKLKNQIKMLEEELRNVQKSRSQETSQIIDVVTNLKRRVDQMVDVRGKRIEELEEKIKERVGKNYQELLIIEKQLKEMEERYETARRAGVPEEKLGRFREKMEVMKEKVGVKKAELEVPVKKPPFRVPRGTPMIKPPKRLIRKHIVIKHRPVVRHEMMFEEPPKAKTVAPSDEKMPAGIPPMPRIPKIGPTAGVPPPPPPPPPGIVPRRKKGFFARLFGR
ncbi:hypothetical protein KY331_00880 [Candidatus Woesearchaeota archaeon]|nr:hypothetical protein [Candidatus Woesearchaeota archaeon]